MNEANAVQGSDPSASAAERDLASAAPTPAPEARPPLAGGWRVAILFLLPSLVGFVIFFLFPTVRAIWLSLTDYNLLKGSGSFVGAENYERLVQDDLFWNALQVTGIYVAINIVSQTIIALALAFAMVRLTTSVVVRGIVLLPWILPNIVVGLLWLFMLDPSVGIVNELLGGLGVDPIVFLNDPDTVIATVAGINTWKFTGYTALLLFAGMQTIPDSLYEAAALDGSSEWQMFKNITLPLLRPIFALVLVISIIGSFQVFDVVQIATGGLTGDPGGPSNASRVIYLYIYENAFLFNRFGYAAALATALMVILLIVTAVQLRLLRASESDLS